MENNRRGKGKNNSFTSRWNKTSKDFRGNLNHKDNNFSRGRGDNNSANRKIQERHISEEQFSRQPNQFASCNSYDIDERRENVKRSYEGEFCERPVHGMDRENFWEGENRERYREGASLPPYADYNNINYTHNKDHSPDYGVNQERWQDSERMPDRFFHDKNRDNLRFEEIPVRSNEDAPQNQPLQQPIGFPVYDENNLKSVQDGLWPQNKASNDGVNFQEDLRKPPLLQPPPILPPYNYNAIRPPFSADNRHAAAANLQWGVNPMNDMVMTTNMPAVTGVEVSQATHPGMNIPPRGRFGDNYSLSMNNGQGNMMVGPVKKIVRLARSVLYPPDPRAPSPTFRDRPLGCKTVFVKGLPKLATEEIVKEVFETCGEILGIRMSEDDFCHIRFACEAFVDNALYFSGYNIKIENNDEAPYVGWLHVDYIISEEDQYEYERKLSFELDAKHRKFMEEQKPEILPSVVYYSDREASALGEKLRKEEKFLEAVNVLVSWLERGDCNKRTASTFYSMIQNTNSHVRRIMNEKLQHEEELNKAKLKLKQKMEGTLLEFNGINKVFECACIQKVWGHFTKPQRKNIKLWKKQAEEIKNTHVEQLLSERVEDDMEVSDNEDKKDENLAQKPNEDLEKENNKLREENEVLQGKLEAAENETVLLKSELAFKAQELELKERYIQSLKDQLQTKA